MCGLEQRDHLRVAGDILVPLAGLCEAKADVLWEDWQDTNNAEGPVMGDGWLQRLTRQTQELDFSDLVSRSYHPSSELPNADKADEDSVAGDALKLPILDMIDALEGDLNNQAMAVFDVENVSAWVKTLVDQQQASPQRLVDIQQ